MAPYKVKRGNVADLLFPNRDTSSSSLYRSVPLTAHSLDVFDCLTAGSWKPELKTLPVVAFGIYYLNK